MITVFKNKKRLSLLFSVFLIVALLASIFSYRVIARKVIKAEIVKISIEKPNPHYHYEMNQQKNEELFGNFTDFANIVYEFDMKNLSNEIQVSSISIKPIFSESMKENVFFYASSDAITNYSMRLTPNKDTNFHRYILIRRNGLTDEELIDMAKKNNFKITYNTFKGDSILSYGYNWQYAEYKGN